MERDFQLMPRLDAHNYLEAWIGEHHFGGYEIYGQPELFIATTAERTRHIRLGTGVISLPYHHPFMVADRIVQLDYQTRDRHGCPHRSGGKLLR
jgi:limonene 1,2-monooxygenase